MTAIKLCPGSIKDTGTPKGRGVFATKHIPQGEVVEICPVIVLSLDWDDLPSELRLVVFAWGNLTKQEPASCVALGWGSMYNHANPANLRYSAIQTEQCLQFTAARSIDEGEELTINYNETNGDIMSADDVWFEDTGIVPID